MHGSRTAALAMVGLGLIGGLLGSADAAPWDKLISLKRVDADPKKTYDLTESNGPWMILACSFSGPQAEQQAKELVIELRQRYKLPAYQYEKTFDLGRDVQGLGVDRFGNPRKMKYRRGKSEIEEIGVLVGDYPTADHPEAQETLRKLKYFQPECLRTDKGRETARSLASLRTIQSYLLADGNDRKKKGPMGHAFVTTNPMLPSEFFVPQGLDEVVLRANEGVEHSLLDCPGKYTVMVARFIGRSRVILREKDMENELSIINKTRAEDSPLVKAAENAANVTAALRREGIEAYEFHDRNASIVTVGSFESIGTPGPDGRIQLDPRIEKIIERFRGELKATPEFPAGRIVPRVVKGIPLDVQSMVVHVPKRPITAALSRQATNRK
jgi:hypothetical protein